MLKTAALTFVLCTIALAQTNSPDGLSKRNAYVLPGDTIVPRIATGVFGTANDGTPLGFFMSFQFMNISAGPASIQMSFIATDGSPLSLKYELCKNTLPAGGQGSCFSPLGMDGLPTNQAAIKEGTFLVDALPVGGVAYARTFINGPQLLGYARVLSAPSTGVAVAANFHQQEALPDGSLRQLLTAFVPLSTSVQKKFFVPSLNAGGIASLAVVSVAGGMVDFRALNSDGTELCSKSVATTVGQGLAFLNSAADFLPCTAGKESMIEVTGSALAGVGFTFLGGSVTTQPVFGPAP